MILIFIGLSGYSQDLQVKESGLDASIRFGLSEIEKSLSYFNHKLIRVANHQSSKFSGYVLDINDKSNDVDIRREGFKLRVAKGTIYVTSNGPAGAMYALLDLADAIASGKNLSTLKDRRSNPHFTVRAVKFNLPWSSYRTGKVMQQHEGVCRDLTFWKEFLDDMARNRFNLLSLWNVHPFSYMVKPTNFPLANNFSETEMQAWKTFWMSLFRMARERNIEPFIVNWNIAVSPEFAAAYHVAERNDTSAIVKRYTKEVVTQVINEYPDLAGIGVTLADWMSNFNAPKSDLPMMTAKSREDWIEKTFVAGMKSATRPVKFLHRSVLSSDPQQMRRVIDNAAFPDTTLVEIKFNWSHGHSTPQLAITHDSHSGKIDEGYWNPVPKNYRIQWMVRNEDFFILRWGQPEFIRRHISTNSDSYVNGYFIGSEGYIPALDYSHKSSDHVTWKYAFQKQWLFYMTWGRLLYDPSTPDSIFELAFDQRYGRGLGKDLLKASSLAGKMPLRLASYFSSTWDYTLYSEGFLSAFPTNSKTDEATSAFISINELIIQPTLDPTYISVSEFVKATADGSVPTNRITPLMLADSLTGDGVDLRRLIDKLRQVKTPTLQCELDDLETWCYLSLYFAEKLRAAVFLETARLRKDATIRSLAIERLKICKAHWENIIAVTQTHYKEVPYLDDDSSKRLTNPDAQTFSWAKYLPQVARDIRLAEE